MLLSNVLASQVQKVLAEIKELEKSLEFMRCQIKTYEGKLKETTTEIKELKNHDIYDTTTLRNANRLEKLEADKPTLERWLKRFNDIIKARKDRLDSLLKDPHVHVDVQYQMRKLREKFPPLGKLLRYKQRKHIVPSKISKLQRLIAKD